MSVAISGKRVETEEAARLWRPQLPGWSDDILPFYETLADELQDGDTFVEVGVCHGRSIVFLAEALGRRGKRGVKLVAIDWWTNTNFRTQWLRTAFSNMTASEIDMIRVVSEEGVRAARLFDPKSLAGIFIDSDHEKDGMVAHLLAWIVKVRKGGIVAGHDYNAFDWPGVVEAVDGFFGASNVKHPTRSVWEVRV